MKTISNSFLKTMLKGIAVSHLFLFLVIASSFGQEAQKNVKVTDTETEWWIPILEKHNVQLKGSNNFSKIFEMGETNSVKDGVSTLTNAYVILKYDSNTYIIIESPLITHDFKKELISTNEGTMKFYKFDSKASEPLTSIQIKEMVLTFPRN